MVFFLPTFLLLFFVCFNLREREREREIYILFYLYTYIFLEDVHLLLCKLIVCKAGDLNMTRTLNKDYLFNGI